MAEHLTMTEIIKEIDDLLNLTNPYTLVSVYKADLEKWRDGLMSIAAESYQERVRSA